MNYFCWIFLENSFLKLCWWCEGFEWIETISYLWQTNFLVSFLCTNLSIFWERVPEGILVSCQCQKIMCTNLYWPNYLLLPSMDQQSLSQNIFHFMLLQHAIDTWLMKLIFYLGMMFFWRQKVNTYKVKRWEVHTKASLLASEHKILPVTILWNFQTTIIQKVVGRQDGRSKLIRTFIMYALALKTAFIHVLVTVVD